MMRYPSKTVGTISGSRPLSFASIIDVWAKAMSVAHQNLLSQQHLVGLHCVDSMSRRVLVIYLHQIDVDVTNDGNLGNEWITRTTSNAVGKMQPMKVSAMQIFHNFDELAQPYSNLPKCMKGAEIKTIPSADTILPPNGHEPLHMVSLPLAISVSHKVINEDLRFDAEAYHHLMGLWSDTLAYQFSSATCLS
eukprot:11952170-Ditylum_brightwellii.AAC.1